MKHNTKAIHAPNVPANNVVAFPTTYAPIKMEFEEKKEVDFNEFLTAGIIKPLFGWDNGHLVIAETAVDQHIAVWEIRRIRE